MPYYPMSDHAQLYVREIGQGEPVLVLSGLGMQSWQWLPFLVPSLKDHRFIIPDWRGFGGSRHCIIPAGLNAIQSHWRDIDCLIEQLQLTQFKLIGYSMGATTAMHGMQYGGLAKKIKQYLHIDQTPKISSDDSWAYGLFGKKYPQFIQLLHEIDQLLTQYQEYQTILQLPPIAREQLMKMWLSFIELQESNKISPLLFKLALKQPQLQKHLLPMHRLDYMAWYIRNYLHHQEDYRDVISTLDCATTFFIGEQSTLYPVQGQLYIADQVKNSTTVVFKRSGHTPLLTEPIKFGREIQSFLKQAS